MDVLSQIGAWILYALGAGLALVVFSVFAAIALSFIRASLRKK